VQKVLRFSYFARAYRGDTIPLCEFPANKDVFGNREMLHHIEFLMDNPNSHLKRMLRIVRIKRGVPSSRFGLSPLE